MTIESERRSRLAVRTVRKEGNPDDEHVRGVSVARLTGGRAKAVLAGKDERVRIKPLQEQFIDEEYRIVNDCQS